jgi:hypothetical protein
MPLNQIKPSSQSRDTAGRALWITVGSFVGQVSSTLSTVDSTPGMVLYTGPLLNQLRAGKCRDVTIRPILAASGPNRSSALALQYPNSKMTLEGKMSKLWLVFQGEIEDKLHLALTK